MEDKIKKLEMLLQDDNEDIAELAVAIKNKNMPFLAYCFSYIRNYDYQMTEKRKIIKELIDLEELLSYAFNSIVVCRPDEFSVGMAVDIALNMKKEDLESSTVYKKMIDRLISENQFGTAFVIARKLGAKEQLKICERLMSSERYSCFENYGTAVNIALSEGLEDKAVEYMSKGLKVYIKKNIRPPYSPGISPESEKDLFKKLEEFNPELVISAFEKAEEHVYAADYAFKKGDLERAIMNYRKGPVDYKISAARLALKKGDKKRAEDIYQEAVDAAQNNIKKAEICKEAGRIEDAFAFYEEERIPENLLRSAKFAEELGLIEKARKIYEEIADKEVYTSINTYEFAMRQNDAELAEKAKKTLLEKDVKIAFYAAQRMKDDQFRKEAGVRWAENIDEWFIEHKEDKYLLVVHQGCYELCNELHEQGNEELLEKVMDRIIVFYPQCAANIAVHFENKKMMKKAALKLAQMPEYIPLRDAYRIGVTLADAEILRAVGYGYLKANDYYQALDIGREIEDKELITEAKKLRNRLLEEKQNRSFSR